MYQPRHAPTAHPATERAFSGYRTPHAELGSSARQPRAAGAHDPADSPRTSEPIAQADGHP
jgi:hypothetical protein